MCNQPLFALYFPVREISRKREPCASPSLLVGIGLRTTHIIWESIRRRVGFTLRAFHLSIPFTSLSLSLTLSLSLSLSYLSLPLYISPSTFLSLSLLLYVFSLSFSLAYLMDVFVLVSFCSTGKGHLVIFTKEFTKDVKNNNIYICSNKLNIIII